MKSINNLDEQMISLIYRGLVKLPYEEVNNLINNITKQLMEQSKPQEALKDE